MQSVEAVSPLLVQTVGAAEVQGEWGRETNMRGLISSLCLFSDNLSASAVKILHRRGPNDLSLFQPKCPETRDLAPRLFVYYHAKACRGGACTNLAPSSADTQLVGHFTGQHYVTRDVKVAPLGRTDRNQYSSSRRVKINTPPFFCINPPRYPVPQQ
jgi:hypothetical protein